MFNPTSSSVLISYRYRVVNQAPNPPNHPANTRPSLTLPSPKIPPPLPQIPLWSTPTIPTLSGNPRANPNTIGETRSPATNHVIATKRMNQLRTELEVIRIDSAIIRTGSGITRINSGIIRIDSEITRIESEILGIPTLPTMICFVNK